MGSVASQLVVALQPLDKHNPYWVPKQTFRGADNLNRVLKMD